MNLARKMFFYLRYFSNPPWDTGITPPEVEAFVASRPPGRALDLGCGTGTNSVYLAQHGWQVTGVDFVSRAITKGREKAKRAGVKVQFLIEDVARLRGVSGPFDLILDIGCLHSLPQADRTDYRDHITQLLDPHGTFLLYAFVNETDDGPGLSHQDLQAFQNCLELVEKQLGDDRGRRSAWFTWRLRPDPSNP
jgi:SAM-dependent methyltransferase